MWGMFPTPKPQPHHRGGLEFSISCESYPETASIHQLHRRMEGRAGRPSCVPINWSSQASFQSHLSRPRLLSRLPDSRSTMDQDLYPGEANSKDTNANSRKTGSKSHIILPMFFWKDKKFTFQSSPACSAMDGHILQVTYCWKAKAPNHPRAGSVIIFFCPLHLHRQINVIRLFL